MSVSEVLTSWASLKRYWALLSSKHADNTNSTADLSILSAQFNSRSKNPFDPADDTFSGCRNVNHCQQPSVADSQAQDFLHLYDHYTRMTLPTRVKVFNRDWTSSDSFFGSPINANENCTTAVKQVLLKTSIKTNLKGDCCWRTRTASYMCPHISSSNILLAYCLWCRERAGKDCFKGESCTVYLQNVLTL